jgi:hypothetical protein
MKALFIVLFSVALSIYTYAQDSAKAYYTAVVKVDSSTKAELYTKARSWFAKTYNSSKSVIQMDDKDAGEIVGRGAAEAYINAGLGVKLKMWVQYTLAVFMKDGKYKYEYNVTGMEPSDPKNQWSRDYNYYLDKSYSGKKAGTSLVGDVEADKNALLASLETAMKAKSTTSDF